MDAAEAETVDANVMQLRTPAATVWRWEMDGAGKGKKGRKSAADRRRHAAFENGDVWNDMTADFHSFPDCPYTDRNGTLAMMYIDVYSCFRCAEQRKSMGVDRWSDYPVEGGLDGPSRELTRRGDWYHVR